MRVPVSERPCSLWWSAPALQPLETRDRRGLIDGLDSVLSVIDEDLWCLPHTRIMYTLNKPTILLAKWSVHVTLHCNNDKNFHVHQYYLHVICDRQTTNSDVIIIPTAIYAERTVRLSVLCSVCWSMLINEHSRHNENWTAEVFVAALVCDCDANNDSCTML